MNAVLRLMVGAGPVLALLCGYPAGLDSVPLLVVAVLLGAAAGWSPDSPALLLADLAVLLGWALAVTDQQHPMAIAAAACLLVSHVAAVLLGYGPSRFTPPPELLRTWLRRGALLLVAAPLAWLVVLAASGSSAVPGVWALGMVVAIALVVAGTLLVGGEPEEQR